MANPQVTVDFVADTARLSRGFSDASSSAGGFSSKLKGLAKVGAAAAGAAGLAALTATIKIGIDEYMEAAKVAAQTNAVIKSTGGVANVSAKQVSNLAESIMKKSGIDDEAIASGENLLLTFTNIRNEAGKGNDIFNQATATMVDMSVALGQDMKSSATQLGKALNDPIKGITALSRVGVTFTEGQKKQITALVESGNTLGAQKLILKELNKEFGGSAEAAGKTLPGMLNIAKESFSNFAGMLVGKVIPYLKLAISWLRDHWPEIQAQLQTAWASMKPTFEALGQIVLAVANLIKDNWGTLGPVVEGFAKAVQITMKVVGAALKLVAAIIRGDWSEAWNQAKRIVSLAVEAMVNAVKTGFAVIRAVVTTAWNVIKAATNAAWDGIKALVRNTVEGVKDILRNLVDWLSNLGGGIMASATRRIGNAFDAIVDGARDAYRAVKDVIGDMVGWLGGIVDRVANAAGRIANAIKSPINAVLGAIDSVKITIPPINLPSIKIAGKRFGGGSIGGFTIDPFPNVPRLATGGVVSQPTLAMVGEGKGREIVAPESLLREIVGGRSVNVRVYIGERELTDMVRSEVEDTNAGIARTLLAGAH